MSIILIILCILVLILAIIAYIDSEYNYSAICLGLVFLTCIVFYIEDYKKEEKYLNTVVEIVAQYNISFEQKLTIIKELKNE